MRFRVQKAGGLGSRTGSYTSIEEALRYAEHLIANKNPGQIVILDDKLTGKTYSEVELAGFISALDEA